MSKAIVAYDERYESDALRRDGRAAGRPDQARNTVNTDLTNCVLHGSASACLWTVATVAGLFLGGEPGVAVRVLWESSESRALAKVLFEILAGREAIQGSEAAAGREGQRMLDAEGHLDEGERLRCVPNSAAGDTTAVSADGGTKRIDQVKVGDRVVATDPVTGSTSARPVDNVIVGHGLKHPGAADRHPGRQLVGQRRRGGSGCGRRAAVRHRDAGDRHPQGGTTGPTSVTATDTHPFWVSARGGWIDAKNLKAGKSPRWPARQPQPDHRDPHLDPAGHRLQPHRAAGLNMTRTVEQHLGDIAKNGTLSRPYGDSTLTIRGLLESSKPVADPGGVPGALRWDAARGYERLA